MPSFKDTRETSYPATWDGPTGIGCEVVIAISHPCLGLCSYSRSTIQNSACGQQFQCTKKKLTAATLRFAKKKKKRAFDRDVEPAKCHFEKHLHACMHCCQPRRQSRSRAVWDVLQTCLGRIEIQSQLRRAVRGTSDASEPQCTTKAGIQRLSLMCKTKNTVNAGVEFSRKWHTNLCPKSQQSQPHIPSETYLYNGPTR